MKKLLVFTLAFAFGAVVSGGLNAQQAAKPAAKRNNSNSDINISSDTFLADLNGKTGTWQGNVVVVQGDMKLRANCDAGNPLANWDTPALGRDIDALCQRLASQISIQSHGGLIQPTLSVR